MPDIELSFLPLPPRDQQVLGEHLSELINAGGDNLESLIIFGSAATTEFDPVNSDINLLVLLRRDDREVLEAIKPPLSTLMRRFKVSPMVTTSEELKTSADVFPVKFLNIKDRHRVLFGYDPFTTMKIRRVHLRLRCEQELKNMALKLRRALVSRASTMTARQDMIRSFLTPFTAVLHTMLTMTDEQPAPSGRLEVLKRAATRFSLPSEQLDAIADAGWGEGRALGEAEIEDLAHAFLAVVARAAAVADRMPEADDLELTVDRMSEADETDAPEPTEEEELPSEAVDENP